MIHTGISYDNYAALEGWTSTDLRLVAGGRTKRHLGLSINVTSDMILGQYVHALILEPDDAEFRFQEGPEGDWRTKATKQTVANLKLDFPGCEVMKPKYFDAGHEMAKMLQLRAGHLLDQIQESEIVFTWDDYKCRVDGVTPHALIELKTTSDARKFKWMRKVRDMDYHIQLAHHDQGMRANGVEGDLDWLHIVVENVVPYEVQIFDYSPNFQERSVELWAAASSRLMIMDDEDGYPGGIEVINWGDVWRQ